MPVSVANSLRRARLELEQVGQALLRPSPEILNACEQRLDAAAAEMEATRPEWPQAVGDPQAAEEARLVRLSFCRARRLLEDAMRFHAGWKRIREAMSGEYRPDGSVSELRCAARIFVEG